MEGRDEALDQLRVIFDLCDSDKDGFISVDDFRRLGSEHFDKTQVSIVPLVTPSSVRCTTS